MAHLPPAYQGAPYYQPRPPPRKRRVLRQIRLAAIFIGALLLIVIIGFLLAHTLP